MKALRFAIEAAAFRIALGMANWLPRRLLQTVGATAGSIGFLADRRHRRIAIGNLVSALGSGLTRGEARRITHQSWRHFGRTTADTLAFPRFGPRSGDRPVRFEGLEHIRAAYARGRGVLLFSGHFGHWELAALMQGYLGLPLVLVTRPLDNPRLERLLAQLRGLSGNRVLHKRNAVREMLRALRAGLGVAIVIDQDARQEGVFVPFFDRPASTTPTLALLALRTGAAIVPVFVLPEPGGSYRIIYEPEVPLNPTENRDADILRLTAECTAIVERWIRRYPQFWLWMHRRWKTPSPSPCAASSRSAGECQ